MIKNKQEYFITDVYMTGIYPHKFTIEWHNRLQPFFGKISFVKTDGKVIVDSEYKDREFVKNILGIVIDQAELIGEEK